MVNKTKKSLLPEFQCTKPQTQSQDSLEMILMYSTVTVKGTGLGLDYRFRIAGLPCEIECGSVVRYDCNVRGAADCPRFNRTVVCVK